MGEHRQYSKAEEALEIKSLRRIINAYLNYPDAAEADVKRYERSYRKLPTAHKELLSHLPVKYQKLRRCISKNTYFIMNMLQEFEPPLDMSQDIDCDDQEIPRNDYEAPLGKSAHQHILTHSDNPSTFSESDTSRHESFVLHGEKNVTEKLQPKVIDKQEMHLGNCCNSEDLAGSSNGCGRDAKTVDAAFSCCTESNCEGKSTIKQHGWMDSSLQLNVPLVDVDKVRCIIRNIVRDWAAEGQKERDQCYKPILQELGRKFQNRSKERPPCCLVPGAGLGRLALEISCHGFECQGNEFSYYMMICSSFILNHTQVAGEWTVYPWIHSNCNSLSDDDQLRPISFPDIHPASAGITEGFSMCGGDFVEVYSDGCQEAYWDAVVTCFFLDTAHNIVEYIEIISRILKPGGVWINLGPLLYHFADSYGSDEMSIELSLEDVKKVAFHYGFEMEMEKNIETTYTANPRSMMQNHYLAAFWTMKKIR